MAYEMVMPYHLHMPSYFLETFTEYPYEKDKKNPSKSAPDKKYCRKLRGIPKKQQKTILSTENNIDYHLCADLLIQIFHQ